LNWTTQDQSLRHEACLTTGLGDQIFEYIIIKN